MNNTPSEQSTTTNSDDMNVLRVLLHTIKGISPVAGGALDFVPIEEDGEV